MNFVKSNTKRGWEKLPDGRKKESPTITGKQMSETLSVSQRTIERDLSAMQKIGVLKREGKDNDGMWVIIST